MNKIVELGLSYHDIAFGKEVMPTLFAKQRENGRAYSFVITDLKGFVSDLSGLTLTMEVGLGTKRQAIEGKNISSEQDGAFIVEIPTIYDYGRARYSLTITDGEKKLTTKNGRLLIEQSLIFDDGEGGDISFDLVEFQKAMKKLGEELEKQDAILYEIKEMNAETQKLINDHDTDIQAIKDEVDQYSQNAMNEMAKSVKEVQNIANKYSLEMSQYAKDIKANTEKALEEMSVLVEESNTNVLVVQSIKNELQDVLDKELERQANEKERVNNEKGRQDMETLRRADENTRREKEIERVDSEGVRVAGELDREENEKNRVSNHSAMQESIKRWSLMMQDWIQAEEERVLSEKTRKELFNQMKKEFDEMMELLGENPVGGLTQELQALKGITDKHFKSAVIQGDDLVLIREDMTELVVPLELNKYATVKALEELEALLTSTKTQLEMKIGKKADKTYVDEKLLTKADTTDLDNYAKSSEMNSKLIDYAKISQLEELKAELLLAIEQGSTEAIKMYADIFSVGNSDTNDIILNTGKIGLILQNITQSELNIWAELTTMEDVINSEEAFNEVINSTTAMNAVANSTTAWNTVMNSTTAFNEVINSTTAFNTVINSTTAMNAVANSTTAMNAVANSTTAWNTVMNSTTAFNTVINSTTAMNAVANSTTAWNTVMNSTTAMNAVANSTTALKAIADSDKAMMTLINHSKTRTHTGESEKSINGIVLSSTATYVGTFSFADGTKTSKNALPYKLSNGRYNVLKSYPKRAVSVAGFMEYSKVNYYPLD